jgi:branched-chain amino acid transport system substrate-binding protein
VVDVLAPADRYWAGLADVLVQQGVDLSGVAVLHAASGFGRATARGAVESLRRAGASPLLVERFSETTAPGAASTAIARGASAVIGCGRIEDDLALGEALAGSGLACGLIVCGIALAHERLGDAVEGWLGPAQWLPGEADPPVPLAPGLDYPAAQALAAGLIAEEALARAGSPDPDCLWREALRLRTRTFLGPFAVDRHGRQTAHAPLIVRWRRHDGELRREAVWWPG